MTKRIWVLLLAFLGCASTQPPRAAATAPAESPKFEVGPGPYNIDLDAGPGRYEERFIQVPDGAFTLKGFIQFITVSKDRKWAPLAAIELMGPKESYNVGLEAFVHSNEPGKLQFAVRDGLHDLWDAPFARADFTNNPFPFELRLLRSGEVQVSIGGKVGKIYSARGFAMTRVRVLASTAHIQFSNVNITGVDAVAEDHGTQHMEFPTCVFLSKQSYFPQAALAQHMQGRVLVEFNVTASGRIDATKVMAAEPEELFQNAALGALANMHCEVPANWVASGGAAQRFRASFVFEYSPGGAIQPYKPNDLELAFRRTPLK
jgi:TonB family protein